MGNNLVMVFPERRHWGVSVGMGQGQTMTAEDAMAIKRELSHLVQGVSPSVRASVQMMYSSKNWAGNVQGVSPDVLTANNWGILEGRFFTDEETDLYSRVCVIGTTVRDNLFGDYDDPIGKTIRLRNITFTIVGVLASKGANNWGQDQDDVVMAPYTSVQRYLQRSKFANINMMNVSLHSMDDLEEAKREITALLRQRHRLADYQDDDFETRDTTELMNTIGSVSGLMTVLLTAVAAISLLVGGIGIMNIMLVSVTERIKEMITLGELTARNNGIAHLPSEKGHGNGTEPTQFLSCHAGTGVAAEIVLLLSVSIPFTCHDPELRYLLTEQFNTAFGRNIIARTLHKRGKSLQITDFHNFHRLGSGCKQTAVQTDYILRVGVGLVPRGVGR